MQEYVKAGLKCGRRLGELVLEYPLLLQVLEREGVDCLELAKVELAEACDRHGIEMGVVLANLDSLSAVAKEKPWFKLSLTDIVHFIQMRYHRPLRAGLPVFYERLLRLEKDYRLDFPLVTRLRSKADLLISDLLRHTDKEDRVLFPWILTLEQGGFYPGDIAAPISVLEAEHDDANKVISELCELIEADDGLPINDASFQQVTGSLLFFKDDLKQHMALENEVLFPRALLLV